MIRLTRRYRFSATHRLHSPDLSEEANREVFGKCNNPFGHGHDYVLDVSAAGPAKAPMGYNKKARMIRGLTHLAQEWCERRLDF